MAAGKSCILVLCFYSYLNDILILNVCYVVKNVTKNMKINLRIIKKKYIYIVDYSRLYFAIKIEQLNNITQCE